MTVQSWCCAEAVGQPVHDEGSDMTEKERVERYWPRQAVERLKLVLESERVEIGERRVLSVTLEGGCRLYSLVRAIEPIPPVGQSSEDRDDAHDFW